MTTHSAAASIISNPFQTPVQRRSIELEEKTKWDSVTVEEKSVVRKKFKNQRLIGEYEKPWTVKQDPRAKYPNIIFLVGMLASCGIGALLIYRSWESVPHYDYCLAFEDNFQTLDLNDWNREVQLDGFGAGSFDWTTDDPKNSYVDSDGLHIVPTLTAETTQITLDQIYDGYSLNLTADATCTAHTNASCAITSDYKQGIIIPPVRSARLTTEGKHTIKYGRVEVVAKLPHGDWLWPAIWMMPQDSVYGAWPASGEIDIGEWRGNNAAVYSTGGIDTMGSTLHWGPGSNEDRYWKTTGERVLRHDDYSTSFNTYGLEWTQDYMFMYLNNRLNQVFSIKFKKGSSMWTRGDFSNYMNPWASVEQPNTPFDQDFFLILNVAVGSDNGFFPDGRGGKPWTDASDAPQRAFANANQTWYPTWSPEGMVVKSVKMWNLGKCPS